MNFMVLGVQIATFMVGGILAGIGLGYLADEKLGIYPWGVIIGVVLGVVLGAVGVIYVVTRERKD